MLIRIWILIDAGTPIQRPIQIDPAKAFPALSKRFLPVRASWIRRSTKS